MLSIAEPWVKQQASHVSSHALKQGDTVRVTCQLALGWMDGTLTHSLTPAGRSENVKTNCQFCPAKTFNG